MKVNTTRFGKITVKDSGVITFPTGIPGFTNQRRYALLDVAEYAPLKWLQSLDESWLAFVILDPYEFLDEDEYDVQVDSTCRSELGLRLPSDFWLGFCRTVNRPVWGAILHFGRPEMRNVS